MRSASRSAFVLALVLVQPAAGGVGDLSPVYTPGTIVGVLQDSKVKKALNIVKYQEAGLKATLATWNMRQDDDAIFKMKGPDKEAKIRAFTERRANELFKSLSRVLSPQQLKRLKQILLQKWGILIFEFPEIREALKLSTQEAENLQKIFEDSRNDVVKKILDGKLSREEGSRQYLRLAQRVPDQIRSALSEEQRKILDDLLGAPYPFPE
jgi:hypothetical protein